MSKVNQTKEFHLAAIRENDQLIGVGLIVIKNREENNIPYCKQVHQDINYAQVLKLGKEAIAMKFIPYGFGVKIRGESIVLSSFDSIHENDWFCNGYCASSSDCNSEVCLCVEGMCY